MREREAKLVVDRSFELPPSHALAKRVASSASENVVQRAVYYDTPDLRLTRSGASLRFRSDDGWTVKLPERRDSSKLVRTEHAFEGGPGTPPDEALNLVRAWTRTQPVIEVARIDTRRQRIKLFDKRGRLLAELDDDDVVGRTRSDTERHFREIEVELAEDAPDPLLDEVVRALRHAGARPAPAKSKVERVLLGDEARAAPDVPDEKPLGPGATVGDLVRTSLTRSLRQLLTVDPALRLDDDIEAVHKARVATRRLRSDLRTFRPLIERAWAEPLRAELKWLGSVLGRVRDADVLLAKLAEKAERLPDEQRSNAEHLIERLRAARARDRGALLEALESDRYARLLDFLVDAARNPRFRDGSERRRAKRVAARIARRPRKRLRRMVRSLGPEPSDQDLHEVRKRAKQARYAHEAVAPVLGRAARRAAKRFALIQEVLGDHQDAVVATRWLLDAARDSVEREEAFVAGELAGLFLVDRCRARARWPAAWKRAKRAQA